MSPETPLILETGAAALLFAAVFAFGGRVHPFRSLVRDRRTVISFGAGMSVAYVFVHLMPELHGVRSAFAESMSTVVRYEGMAIYFVALAGFLLYYGLDHLRARAGETGEGQEDGAAFRRHVGGFAVYVGLIAYLLVRSLEETKASTAEYAVAIAFHFLAVDHGLRSEDGVAYDRFGRWALAAMSLAGWGAGLLLPLPQAVVALLVAAVSGAVIVNTCIAELPREKDGRFAPFTIGALLYGLLLLPLG